MTTYSSILQAAMKLSAKERAEMADALWQTVDESSDEQLLAEMSDAQRAEIARRSAEISAGKAPLRTWEEVRDRARRHVG